MRQYGLANWALSMGRQRVGALTLHNHPLFLQNLDMPRLKSATGKIDVLALDIIRDRERGIPRYNEYRRQYGLKQLTSFDDFIDPRLAQNSPQRAEQQKIVARAARNLRAAQMRRGEDHHDGAEKRRRQRDQRLPRPRGRQRGR